MWRRVEPYINFCRLSLYEFKSGREGKWMRLFYLAAGFLIAVVLDLILGIPVRQWAKAVFDLLHWHWWVVIFLSLVTFFLLLVIEGARRYHERTVKELNAEHASDISERKGHADIMHRLSIVYGMVLQADDTIRDFSTPLPKEALVYLNAHIDNALYQCFGAQGRDKYYEGMRGMPDTAELQRGWIYAHRSRLDGYVEYQRAQLVKPKPKPILPS